MFEKSIDAIIASIEIYNKPSFSYREEAFSILIINAWELLFKARILQLNQNKVNSILEYERRKKSDGSKSKKLYYKKNRSGNCSSIGIFKAYNDLVNKHNENINLKVLKNLEALAEVRDNAVHFLNKSTGLRKKVYELGTANLKNFLYYSKEWFGESLNKYQLFLMPIAFAQDVKDVDIININSSEKNLLKYIQKVEQESINNSDSDLNFTLNLEMKINRQSHSEGMNVRISNDPGAIAVMLSEEDLRKKFPLEYYDLTYKLQDRYRDFIINKKYHEIRKKLEAQEKFCRIRYLDPDNPKSPRKKFYNSNIILEFDKLYTKK